MTTTHDDTTEHGMDAQAGQSRSFRPRSRRVDVDDIAEMIRRAEMKVQAEKAAAAPRQSVPWGTVFAAVASSIALIFTGLTFLSSSTQDKVDRGTQPLNIQISEMDKRVTGRLDSLDKNVEKISTRMDGVEARLTNIEMRLERIDSKLK